MKNFLLILFLISTFLLLSLEYVFAEKFEVRIPFGAYNPELNTPAEVWYDPPIITVFVGDTITWYNDDREGHTVTSGQSSGRFGWMNKDFGTPDGIFESGRFMPQETWSYAFEKEGTFPYFCTIHPWMEGAVKVQPLIPNFPVDSLGNQIAVPAVGYTADNLIEIDLTWEPNVIKTHEKVVFIYQTYDPATNSNLDKMSYDIIIEQNGKEVFRDDGITSVGGDYRNFLFEEAGPINIRFENIESWGTSGIESGARGQPAHPSLRVIQFGTIVYENPDRVTHHQQIVQPKQTFQLYYEIAVSIIVVPAILFVFVIFMMKRGKPLSKFHKRKSAPI